MKTNKEKVNHPKHYRPGTYEAIKVIDAWGFGEDFCVGNTLKYLSRAKLKHKDQREDIQKAIWYLKHLLELLEERNER